MGYLYLIGCMFPKSPASSVSRWMLLGFSCCLFVQVARALVTTSQVLLLKHQEECSAISRALLIPLWWLWTLRCPSCNPIYSFMPFFCSIPDVGILLPLQSLFATAGRILSVSQLHGFFFLFLSTFPVWLKKRHNYTQLFLVVQNLQISLFLLHN